ncbi:MAG: efflux RND transporter permease subunit [Gemmatimonadetes bacterium]|nr:efflux RND transporter permease subunit [Gemmatimonadota bacterium]
MKTGPSGRVAGAFLNSKLTPLLMMASLVAGVGGLMTTPREEEPQIRVPMIDVTVGLPGASPKEVERRVVEPLERAIWEVPGVEYVYSMAQADGALITARFQVGTEPELALTRLYGKLLANASSAPPGATPPLVALHGINEVPILTVTLSGGADSGDGYLLRQQAAELAAEMKRIPDVAETWVIGGAPREVEVLLDLQALAARGLSAAAVAHALGQSNAELPAGHLVRQNKTLPLRVGHLLRDVDQVREVVLGVDGDRAIRLGDVATVSDGPAKPTQYVEYLDAASGVFEPAVTIAVAKREGKNAATIAEQVMHRVDELTGDLLAEDVRVTVTRDYGETATEKSRELLLHILIATLGVALLVWATLGWREAVVVLVAVPVTLALTLLVYRLFGYTLNRITLFALVFAIGILVDDAIVVVENIARHLALKQRTPDVAAVVAVDEVGNPTILATLTVIAAILPMAFVSGLMGPYMRPIPVGASVAMLFSLAVAFIVTPYLAVRLLRGHGGEGSDMVADGEVGPAEARHTDVEEDTSADAEGEALPAGRLAGFYRRLLESLLASGRRRAVAYGTMVFLLGASVVLVPLRLVTVKMLPFDNKSEFQLIVDTPEGTTLEETARIAKDLALAVSTDEAVANVQTYAGIAAPFNFNGLVRHYFLRRGPNVADIQVNLLPKHHRDEQSHDIALRLRPIVDSIARVHEASVKLAEIPPGPPVYSTLTAEIYGPNYVEQVEIAAAVKDVFESTEGVVDVDWSVAAAATELRVLVDQGEAMRGGTNPAQVAQTVAATFGHASAGLLHDESAAEPVPIRLAVDDASAVWAGDVDGIPIATPSGSRRVGSLAQVSTHDAPGAIFRKNLRPVVYVTADVAGALESPAYAMLAMESDLQDIAEDFRVHYAESPTLTDETFLVWDGEWKITVDVFRDLGIAFAAVLVLIYVLVVAWFQSYLIPLVIMAPIPLTLIGILPAHALSGAFFTATSMIGMIALAGIIVRNSILLVDFVQLGRERGQSVHDAVIASGMIRARPIVLTAAAVVIGGAVMVTDPIFQGLGIALISGAIVSTALTLVAIPLLYYEMGR